MLYAATGHTIPYHTSMADHVKHHFQHWNVQYLPINAVFRFQRNKKGKNKIRKFKASLHKCDITRADMEENGIVLHKLWNVRYSLCDLREKCFHMWVWWQTDTNHSSYEGPPILYIWYLNVKDSSSFTPGALLRCGRSKVYLFSSGFAVHVQGMMEFMFHWLGYLWGFWTCDFLIFSFSLGYLKEEGGSLTSTI